MSRMPASDNRAALSQIGSAGLRMRRNVEATGTHRALVTGIRRM